jgi:hypothetical protein
MSYSLEELDLAALRQGHDRLLPARAATGEAADALLLAASIWVCTSATLTLRQRLDRLA